MRTGLLYLAAGLALLVAGACGDDAIVVNDEGVSSGGVKLDTIEPERGSILGGNNVLLQGEGLGGNNVVVAFGDVAVDDVVILSAEAVLVVAPRGVNPGQVDIVVANAQGFAQRNLAYVYNDPPTIASVDPESGSRLGGEVVTLTGTGFLDFDAGAADVTFDGEPVDAVEVVSDTEITVTTPPGMPFSAADILVTNRNGAGQLADGYIYEANGLYASARDTMLDCGGAFNDHRQALIFFDLDDGTVIDIGTDRPNGFNRIASDAGKLVGSEGCSKDIYEINRETGETTLFVDTQDPGGANNLSGLIRDGNDFLVRDPANNALFARLSTSTGVITPLVGAGNASDRSGSLARNGANVFWVGRVLDAQGANINGIAQVDPATGAQVGAGVLMPFQARGAVFHRGELFTITRTNLGKGSSEFVVRFLLTDPTDGSSAFVGNVPIYVRGLASGDLP